MSRGSQPGDLVSRDPITCTLQGRFPTTLHVRAASTLGWSTRPVSQEGGIDEASAIQTAEDTQGSITVEAKGWTQPVKLTAEALGPVWSGPPVRAGLSRSAMGANTEAGATTWPVWVRTLST